MTLDDQIKCVAREIALRKRVYPKWVDSGRMKNLDALREIETMIAVIESLKAFKAYKEFKQL